MKPQYWIICYDDGPDNEAIYSTIMKANSFEEAINKFDELFGDRILSVMPMNEKCITDWEYIDIENNFRDQTSHAFK